jgi:hypothetical protein
LDVMEMVERLIHGPPADRRLRQFRPRKRLQSGRLDVSVAYVLIALVAALAFILVLT